MVPEECQATAYQSKCQIHQAIGDLAIITFYYLLRVGEYTKPRTIQTKGKTKRATRTVQFSIKDIGFFKDNRILPRASPLETLTMADSCTLKITNQKNGRMGQTIHQFAINKTSCPVKALAHRVHHILHNGGTKDNLLCDVWNTTKKAWIQITSKYMMKHIRQIVTKLDLKTQGLDPDLI